MSRVVSSSSSGVSGWCAQAQKLTPPKINFSILAKFLLFPAMLSILLSACAVKGDFGRLEPTIFKRMADDLLTRETTIQDGRGGSVVTNDEMAMREAGYRLASPLMPLLPSAAGARGGYGAPRSSNYRPSNPVAAIDESLQIDHQALTQFGLAARRVMFADSRRMREVNEIDSMQDEQLVLVRKNENFAFIEQTFQDFGRRLQAYYFALDESKISDPDLVTVKMDGSLRDLRDRSESLEYKLTKYFGASVARRRDYHLPRLAAR